MKEVLKVVVVGSLIGAAIASLLWGVVQLKEEQMYQQHLLDAELVRLQFHADFDLLLAQGELDEADQEAWGGAIAHWLDEFYMKVEERDVNAANWHYSMGQEWIDQYVRALDQIFTEPGQQLQRLEKK